MSIIDWGIVVLFIGALVTIGFLFSHRNKNIEDYPTVDVGPRPDSVLLDCPDIV